MTTIGGQIIRSEVSPVSVIGRATQGVRLINLGDEDEVVAIARIPEEEKGALSGPGDTNGSGPAS